ncbi:MAG: DUF4340 domain-containing protein [Planctomycetota bacterium]|jgi:hypothetical protein|nr:DUF4340 domain-containing protein [Planctomycetota bacterium]
MKYRSLLILVVIMAAIVILGVNFKPKPPGGAVKSEPRRSGKTAEIAFAPAVLEAEGVDSIGIFDSAGAAVATLAKTGGAWRLVHPRGIPIDSAKAARLVDDVFIALAVPGTVPGENPEKTGLADGQGVSIALADTESGVSDSVRIGFSPPGQPEKTWVMRSDGTVVLAPADLRGDIGLWKNAPGARPNIEWWQKRAVFGVDPERIVGIDLESASPRLTLAKETPGWKVVAGGPAGHAARLDQSAASEWIRTLSWIVPGTSLADADAPKTGSRGSVVRLTLDDGSVVEFAAAPEADGSALATVSTVPDVVFRMPSWRFGRYFNRFFALFPDADPRFDVREVRFVDLRGDGDGVKFALQGGAWSAVGVRYPLRIANLRRWIAAASDWKPEAYIGGDRQTGAGQFAPTLEISLASGVVRQYRLFGGDKSGAMRPVLVDGANLFSTPADKAEKLFPPASTLFYLGAAIPAAAPEAVTELSVAGAALKYPARLHTDGTGRFVIDTGDETAAITPETAAVLFEGPLSWHVADFHPGGQSEFASPYLSIIVRTADKSHGLILGVPVGGYVAVLRDDGVSFRIGADRVDAWLSVFKNVTPVEPFQPVGAEMEAPSPGPFGEPPVPEPGELDSLPNMILERDRVKPVKPADFGADDLPEVMEYTGEPENPEARETAERLETLEPKDDSTDQDAEGSSSAGEMETTGKILELENAEKSGGDDREADAAAAIATSAVAGPSAAADEGPTEGAIDAKPLADENRKADAVAAPEAIGKDETDQGNAEEAEADAYNPKQETAESQADVVY